MYAQIDNFAIDKALNSIVEEGIAPVLHPGVLPQARHQDEQGGEELERPGTVQALRPGRRLGCSLRGEGGPSVARHGEHRDWVESQHEGSRPSR